MRHTVAISLPQELGDQLDEFSRLRGLTRSDVVRDAVRRYLAVEEFRALRQRLIPLAEAQGVFTDEDVFRSVS
jgi:metal-responsive CopG/Arc/MetJ family transcriptional regulator